MSDIAVRVEGLGKRYRLGAAQGRASYNSLRESLVDAVRAALRRMQNGKHTREQTRELWALKDVSFEVKHGEVLGIIGRNGAGKSTLLKLLSRITEPTTGFADVYGRVGSLLEVGTGFHPELTGRENIYLNGAILGMSKADIQRRFDEIVTFAELERFLDTPVKRYSSGMYMRLAFSVAAHLEPEVLVVDEVLAVGDAEFQKKCMGKMGDVAKEGRTVLFVSHNMATIERLCSSALLLRDGEVMQEGAPPDVVAAYIEASGRLSSDLSRITTRQGSGAIRLVKFEMRDPNGGVLSCARTGDSVDLCLQYRVTRTGTRIRDLHVAIGVHSMRGERLFHLATATVPTGDFTTAPSEGWVICRIDQLPLLGGAYSLNLFATLNGDIADWIQEGATIEVESADFFGTGRLPPQGQGPFAVKHSWRMGPLGG